MQSRLPDRTIENFRASKSLDRRFWSTENSSIFVFRGLKIVLLSVGFNVSRSRDCCQILSSLWMLCQRFWSSKFVRRSVGYFIPDEPFHNLGALNPSLDVPELHKNSSIHGFWCFLKLGKGSSGNRSKFHLGGAGHSFSAREFFFQNIPTYPFATEELQSLSHDVIELSLVHRSKKKHPLFEQMCPELLYTDLKFEQIKSIYLLHVYEALHT